MLLRRLVLSAFRNYGHLDQAFHTSRVVFHGANAQGKSNLMEAIAILAWGHSPRTDQDRDVIQWGQARASIRGELMTRHGSHVVEAVLTAAGRRALKVDGQPQRRLADFVGHLNVVYFSAEDLGLVKGGPSARRRWLDRLLAQWSPRYLYDLQQYQKVLQQRNASLKQLQVAGGDLEQLEVWDLQVVALGEAIMQTRERLVAQVDEWANLHHQALSGGCENLELAYRPNCQDLEGELKRQRRRDVERATTGCGPHRDDLLLSINGKDSRHFSSQGQQRTLVLALKLAELGLLIREKEDPPLLLLDDVLAELDPLRQGHLLQAVGHQVQTFLTTTHLDPHSPWREGAALFEVHEGKLAPGMAS